MRQTPTGKRNKYVAIEQPVAPASRFATGGTWAEVCKAWVSIEPLAGRELWNAQQVQSLVTHRIRMLYRAGITSAMRVKWGSRYFNIASVINPEEANVELELMATEVV